MPEQRARVLSATRSPSKRCRVGPWTVATWALVLRGITEPSAWCHSTLLQVLDQKSGHVERRARGDVRTSELVEDLVDEWHAGYDTLAQSLGLSSQRVKMAEERTGLLASSLASEGSSPTTKPP